MNLKENVAKIADFVETYGGIPRSDPRSKGRRAELAQEIRDYKCFNNRDLVDEPIKAIADYIRDWKSPRRGYGTRERIATDIENGVWKGSQD